MVLRTIRACSGEPAGFAHVLIVESAQPGGHYSASAEIANGFAMVTAIDHGQASYVIAQHFSRSFGDEFVGMRERSVCSCPLPERPLHPRDRCRERAANRPEL